MADFIPKINWQPDDPVTEGDFNRIEQGIADAHSKADNANLLAKDNQQSVQKLESDMSELQGQVAEGLRLGNDVDNLFLTTLNEGTVLRVSFENQKSNDILLNEIYVSDNVNISNMTRDIITNYAIKVENNETNPGATVEYSQPAEVGKRYYVKVFVKYNIAGNIVYSKGVASSIDAEDLTPPDNVTGLTVKAGNTEVILTWVNPTNDDFAGVKVVRKTGAYPTNENDGTIIAQGKITTFKDVGLTNNTTYYYQIFPYDTQGNHNRNTDNRISATPIPYFIYGVKIEKANSNPETSVTYTDDAVGMTPMAGNNGNFSYGSWANTYPLNEIKPCVFKNGVVQYYLNPNDYTKKMDGTAADITTGNDGDVMIEFPKVWWKIYDDGTYLNVKFATAQVDETFKALAHKRGSVEKDKIYISAYHGWKDGSNKLRSLSGKTPTASQTIGTFRTQAQANGVGYDQFPYFPLLMLQVLGTVWFRSRDSQSALGRGFVDGNSAATTTGGTNTKGLFYGETTGKKQLKFAGIEDFWGNVRYLIDGIYSDSNRHILIGTDNFNDTGVGYADYGQGATADISGYIDQIQGGTETGFIVKSKDGSETTYYCDVGRLYAGRLACFGGTWSVASNAGAFFLYLSLTASDSYSSYSGRLAYI